MNLLDFENLTLVLVRPDEKLAYPNCLSCAHSYLMDCLYPGNEVLCDIPKQSKMLGAIPFPGNFVCKYYTQFLPF